MAETFSDVADDFSDFSNTMLSMVAPMDERDTWKSVGSIASRIAAKLKAARQNDGPTPRAPARAAAAVGGGAVAAHTIDDVPADPSCRRVGSAREPHHVAALPDL